MTEQNALEKREERRPVVASMDTVEGFEALQRMAKMFSQSDIVPERFRNIANAVICLDMAHRMGANPLMVAQNLYVVHGTPGWSAKFLIATFNQSRRFSPIRYEFVGTRGKEDWGCRATSKDLETGDKIEGALVTMGIAKAEGWSTKNGSKWQTIPELMLQYRAATFLIRTTAPEISMGLQTVEEIEDVPEMWVDAKSVDDPFAPGRHKLPNKRIKHQGEAIPEVSEDDGYKSAVSKLSAIYDGREEEIDKAFSEMGVDYSAPDLKYDETEEEVRRIAIEVSKKL